MLGPTGIGILYINRRVQHEVLPYQYGGGMVFDVGYGTATYLKPPHCFEAGTGPIAEVIGLNAAVSYLQDKVPFDALQQHEASLCKRLISGLQQLTGIHILGPVDQLSKQGHIVSFYHEKLHPHDIGAYLDQHDIMVG